MNAKPFKYRAFISYSHDDRRWGRWLQSRLESYRVPSDLVGRKTDAGPVPPRLRPIFRDRWDLSAGHSLDEAIVEALIQSQFLIVVCSPTAAGSPYVDAEIRRFKALGRSENVLAIIVDGEPSDPEKDCFPPMLRHQIGSDGELQPDSVEPIAADARDEGDGAELALLKVIGGLLAVTLNEIRQREEVARRRRQRMWMGIAAAMALLAILASGAAGYAWWMRGIAERRLLTALDSTSSLTAFSGELIRRHSIPIASGVRMLDRASKSFDDLRISAEGGDSVELQHRKAQMHLALADNYLALGRQAAGEQSATSANEIMRAVVARTPDDLMRRLDYVRSITALGNIALAKGDIEAAETAFRDGQRIGRDVVEQNPGADDWYNSLAVSHAQLASVNQMKGNFTAAARDYRAARRILAKLREEKGKEPELHDKWVHNYILQTVSLAQVMISHKIGDIADAERFLNEALAISLARIQTTPYDYWVQHERTLTLVVAGQLHGIRGEFDAADRRLAESLANAQGAAQRDPQNIRNLELVAQVQTSQAMIAGMRRDDHLLETRLKDAIETSQAIVATVKREGGMATLQLAQLVYILAGTQERLNKADASLRNFETFLTLTKFQHNRNGGLNSSIADKRTSATAAIKRLRARGSTPSPGSPSLPGQDPISSGPMRR